MDIATLVEGGISRNPLSRIAPASANPSHSLPVINRNLKDGEVDGKIRKYRKRDPASLTKSACLSCKRAKAKCDGRLPCGRCTQRVDRNKPETCIYEPRLRGGKSDLLRQFADLQTKYDLAKHIFQGLLLPDRTPEILDRLRNGETFEHIVKWLNTLPCERMLASELSHKQLPDHHKVSNRDGTVNANPPVLAAQPILALESEKSDLLGRSSHASEPQPMSYRSSSPQSLVPESDQSSVVDCNESTSADKDQILQSLAQENIRLSVQVQELQALLKPPGSRKAAAVTATGSHHVVDDVK